MAHYDWLTNLLSCDRKRRLGTRMKQLFWNLDVTTQAFVNPYRPFILVPRTLVQMLQTTRPIV